MPVQRMTLVTGLAERGATVTAMRAGGPRASCGPEPEARPREKGPPRKRVGPPARHAAAATGVGTTERDVRHPIDTRPEPGARR